MIRFCNLKFCWHKVIFNQNTGFGAFQEKTNYIVHGSDMKTSFFYLQNYLLSNWGIPSFYRCAFCMWYTWSSLPWLPHIITPCPLGILLITCHFLLMHDWTLIFWYKQEVHFTKYLFFFIHEIKRDGITSFMDFMTQCFTTRSTHINDTPVQRKTQKCINCSTHLYTCCILCIFLFVLTQYLWSNMQFITI